MERKRKLPARAARVESVSKKRTSTPPEPRSQPTPPPPAPVEEPLPKHVAAGKPLPTIDEPQPNDLSSKDFQTISESAVLEESLKRSKARWLSEGIFERYWTKPTKKKGVVEPANNPPKESMTKLGTCQITVEPHIFDAQMYAIKEPALKQPPGPPSQQAMYRPIIQYGPPNGMMPPPPAPVPSPVQQQLPKPAPPKPQDTPMANSTPPKNTHTHPSPQQNGAGLNGQRGTNPQPSPPSNNPPAQPSGATKSTDPVIQMLAERAATDPDLKGLMRIVANGEATQEELKRFQLHIDELTQLQKARQATAAAQIPPQHNQPPPPPPTTPAHVNGHANGHPPPSPRQSPAPIAKAAPTPPLSAPKPQPQYQAQPQALRSKGPVPATKPDISGIVFEFMGGSGDRFLFPKFSILEYLPQGQVVASFLIVRKGSSSDSPKYDPDLDYYQPITIRLYAHQGRQLDALQKVVAPPEEVRRYMDDIMDNMTRAEYVLLAMQLPKDSSDSTPAEKNDDTETKDASNNQVLWATTNPTPLPVVKPVEKIPTDEENYQGFIATVS